MAAGCQPIFDTSPTWLWQILLMAVRQQSGLQSDKSLGCPKTAAACKRQHRSSLPHEAFSTITTRNRSNTHTVIVLLCVISFICMMVPIRVLINCFTYNTRIGVSVFHAYRIRTVSCVIIVWARAMFESISNLKRSDQFCCVSESWTFRVI